MTSVKADFPEFFLERVGKPLLSSIPLSQHSSFRIGGDAEFFFEAQSPGELRQAVCAAREFGLLYYVMGVGSNILFADEGFHGLIIRNKVTGIYLKKEEEIEVYSGARLASLLQFCLENNLGGLEFLAGIPGTAGGAVFGNAGAFGQNIGDFLNEAVLLDKKGQEKTVTRQYFSFGYRDSFLKKKHDVLLKSVFLIKPRPRESIQALMEETLKKRKDRHPPQDVACAGSYFKNLILPSGEKVAAALLLDQVGAKELSAGDAAVYSGHANFIVNRDRARARDVLNLAEELKRRVRERFGLELEEEVIFLPADFSMP